MPGHRVGILLAAGGALLFSFDGLLIRAQELSPLGVLFWRSVFACLAYGSIAFLAARRLPSQANKTRRSWVPIFVMAALIVFSNGTFVFSVTSTSIAQTLVIVASVPMATGILGYFVLREQLPRRTWLAGAACLVGVLVVVSGSLGRIGLRGDLWAIACVAAQAAVFVFLRRHPRMSRPEALVVAAIVATVCLAPFAAPFPDVKTAAAAVVDGFLIVPGGWMLTSIAPRYMPAAEVSLFLLIETILGPIWVFFTFGEAPTAAVILSAAVILGAIAIHSWIDLRSPASEVRDKGRLGAGR